MYVYFVCKTFTKEKRSFEVITQEKSKFVPSQHIDNPTSIIFTGMISIYLWIKEAISV